MQSTTKTRLTKLLSALAIAGAATLSIGTSEAAALDNDNCDRASGNICFPADHFYFNAGVGVETKRGHLTMQEDGNLVLKDEAGRVRWASNTQGNPGAWAVFQEDGNLVVYRGTRAIFASHTQGRGAYLVLQVDGNLVIYNDADAPIWATNTGH